MSNILAYLAGIIDGEGSIHIAKGTSNSNRVVYTPRISIGMTRPEPLIVLQELYGGNIAGPDSRLCYTWQCGSQDRIKNILHDLLPYLLVKDINARVMLEFISLRGSTRGIGTSDDALAQMDKYFNLMRKLNSGPR